MYGGSPGHNAPAGFHKDSLENYKKTFLLSNITPQEVVFNSGRWVLLEKYCKNIINQYRNVRIITGSIPGLDRKFNDSVINIPTHMWKIVIVYHDNKTYMVTYLMPNKPATDEEPISKFVISVTTLKKRLEKVGIHIPFDQPDHAIPLIRLVFSLDVKMDEELKNQMESARLYGKLIYAKTLKELREVYNSAKKKGKIGHYHEIYYDLAKKRLEAS